jgi:hypothetical protein
MGDIARNCMNAQEEVFISVFSPISAIAEIQAYVETS